MKTAIYSLYQSNEFDRAKHLIRQLLPVLNQSRQLLIWVNEDREDGLPQHARQASPFIRVLGCAGNVGVASGRNALVKYGIDAGFEFFISCDNDLLLEDGYFEKIETAYARLRSESENVGIVQPVLLDGRKLKGCLGIENIKSWRQVGNIWLGGDALARLWPSVVGTLGKTTAIDAIYHTGVSNPWLAHFRGGAVSNSTAWKQPGMEDHKARFLTEQATLRSAPELLGGILGDGTPVEVYTVAGGVSAFHKDVVDRIGNYDERFDPFGYEDSEYGFRATNRGLRNYLLPTVFAVHDPFMGDSNRTLISHAVIARLRAVEINDLVGDDVARGYTIGRAVLFGWGDHDAQISRALGSTGSDHQASREASTEFFASYVLNFLYGLFGNADQLAIQAHLFDCILPTGLGRIAVQDIAIPFDYNCCFAASDIEIAQAGAGTPKRSISLRAMNCRFEERLNDDETISSRYTDMYFVCEQVGLNRFHVRLNMQANEDTSALTAIIDCSDALASRFIRAPKVHDVAWTGTHYDLGSFSSETVYPRADFHRSKSILPELKLMADSIRKRRGAFRWLVDAVSSYFSDGQINPESTPGVRAEQAYGHLEGQRKKILLFTDSRGQHKPTGHDFEIFGQRLLDDPRLDVDMFLCPMKWTTTLDFLAMFDSEKLSLYHAIILWTGIVDWSPRPVGSAINDVYHNCNTANPDGALLNTRDYSRKVVNNKKGSFDAMFGEEHMSAHFATPFETVYAGEETSNMYSLDMAQDLLRALARIKNLIYVNANRFVPGWDGNFKKGRPDNISLTHAYSDLFTEFLSKSSQVIDLRRWSNDEVKIYTCDNIHVTEAGSDYIYQEIMRALDMQAIKRSHSEKGEPVITTKNALPIPDVSPSLHEINESLVRSFSGFSRLERFIGSKRQAILNSVGAESHLASLVIGVRLRAEDSTREQNLRFMLKWLEYHYPGMFDVLLVEQDSCQRLDMERISTNEHVRHEFIYNPGEYNRGWGYNVAVRNFCQKSKVVVLMDTDVLTGANFVREVIDCHSKFDAVSPYQNVYYTTKSEAEKIYSTYACDHLVDATHIKAPVTLAGGILIIRRDVYLALKGFEQYVGYGCEDRALDVTLFNHLPSKRVRIAPVTYVHLFHPRNPDGRSRFEEIYTHLVANYGCKYEPSLGPFDFIHKNCTHTTPHKTLEMMRARADAFADPDLYRGGQVLSINGTQPRNANSSRMGVVYPPKLTSLREYKERELYKSAPPPDTAELATFHNAYRGKRCFIIGNGPSLNKHDLSLLEDEYTFGVNSFFYKTRETGFVPFFYVVEDSSVMKENIDEIRAYNAPFKFFPTNYKSLHPKQPNTFFFRMNRGFYEKSSPNYAVPRFSTDASETLYCGQSVTYINLQLAYFMGFEEVYLIGMDFSYKIPSSHKRTGDILLSDTDDPNHFHKDYFGKGKTWKDPKLDRVATSYRLAKVIFESTGRIIYNATIGGHLEIFERVAFNGLFHGRDSSAHGKPASASYVPNRQSANRGDSISAAHKLFASGRYYDCSIMCDRLFQTRGLRMYRDLADRARLRFEVAGFF